MGLPTGNKLRKAAMETTDKSFAGKLTALAEIADGVAKNEAAARAGVGVLVLEKWERIVDAGGIPALRDAYPIQRTARGKPQEVYEKEHASGDALVKLAAETADARLKQRMLIVAEQLRGRTSSSTADMFGIPVSTASTWLQFYRQKGLEGITPAGRRGRPPSKEKSEKRDR